MSRADRGAGGGGGLDRADWRWRSVWRDGVGVYGGGGVGGSGGSGGGSGGGGGGGGGDVGDRWGEMGVAERGWPARIVSGNETRALE